MVCEAVSLLFLFLLQSYSENLSLHLCSLSLVPVKHMSYSPYTLRVRRTLLPPFLCTAISHMKLHETRDYQGHTLGNFFKDCKALLSS